MKALRFLLALTLCWLACASESRAYMVNNRVGEKSEYQPVSMVCYLPQLVEPQQLNGEEGWESASGAQIWTKFDPEGLFAGTPLDAGEWFGAVFSGAGSGLYDNTVGAAVQGYHSGEHHMEGGFSEIANAHSAMDVTIGVLGIVAATGDATGAVMAVTPEGKVEKTVVEGGEKLVAEKVEQKAAGVVESSAKADATKAADAAKGPVKPGDTGTYGEHTDQKKAFGETEPLDMDHQPSFAAQVKAREAALGRKLEPEELAKLKANTPAVASPREVHQQTSPTYGGRNTASQSSEDAANLEAARARDRAAYDKAMEERK